MVLDTAVWKELKLYEKVPGFAGIAEVGYHLVASNWRLNQSQRTYVIKAQCPS